MNTKARAAALLAAGVVAGGVVAGTVSANAASGTSGTTGTSTSSYAAPPTGAPGGPRGGGGPSGQNPNETLVTGSNLATLKAAALKAVPGGTVNKVETDSGDAAYEAHMTKADGTQVTVKFDKNLAVKAVEDGMGK